MNLRIDSGQRRDLLDRRNSSGGKEVTQNIPIAGPLGRHAGSAALAQAQPVSGDLAMAVPRAPCTCDRTVGVGVALLEGPGAASAGGREESGNGPPLPDEDQASSLGGRAGRGAGRIR